MTLARRPSDVAASVRARLLNLSRARRVEFQLPLSEFAIERLLYRLSISAYEDRFVLRSHRPPQGAPHRPHLRRRHRQDRRPGGGVLKGAPGSACGIVICVWCKMR